MSESNRRTQRAKELASRNRDLEAETSRLLSTAAQVEVDTSEAARIAAEAHKVELDALVESARGPLPSTTSRTSARTLVIRPSSTT